MNNYYESIHFPIEYFVVRRMYFHIVSIHGIAAVYYGLQELPRKVKTAKRKSRGRKLRERKVSEGKSREGK